MSKAVCDGDAAIARVAAVWCTRSITRVHARTLQMEHAATRRSRRALARLDFMIRCAVERVCARVRDMAALLVVVAVLVFVFFLLLFDAAHLTAQVCIT